MYAYIHHYPSTGRSSPNPSMLTSIYPLHLEYKNPNQRSPQQNKSSSRRQTRQHPPQLPQHNGLLRRARIQLARRHPDADTGKAPARPDDRTLRRQPRGAAGLHIRRRDHRQCAVDSRKHELELPWRRAARAVDGGVVDVEPRPRRKIWFPGCEQGLRDVGGEVGVDVDVGLRGSGPGGLGAGGAAEGDGGYAFFRGFGRGADGAGAEGCDA